MTTPTTNTSLTERQQAALAYLAEAAAERRPCPTAAAVGKFLGIPDRPARHILTELIRKGCISSEGSAQGRRVITILATGQKTAPSLVSNEPAKMTMGWPKATLTPEQFAEAVGRAGHFRDSRRAIFDFGSREPLPPRGMMLSFGGVSDVYGASGMRTGGGSPL